MIKPLKIIKKSKTYSESCYFLLHLKTLKIRGKLFANANNCEIVKLVKTFILVMNKISLRILRGKVLWLFNNEILEVIILKEILFATL